MKGQQGERKLNIRSKYDEESIPVDNLQEAERMFVRLAAMLLIDDLGTSESLYSLEPEKGTHGEFTA